MSSCRNRLNFALINFLAIGWGLHLSIAQAQETAKPKFPFPNPIQMTEPDPLLPLAVFQNQRSLSPLELRQLNQDIEKLQAEGETQFQSGNRPQAFDIWLRELRLRRYLDVLAEVKALGRVGSVAWEERETSTVRVITERLQQIEQSLPNLSLKPTDEVVLQQSLGQAYEQVRVTELATAIYNQELARSRETGDTATQELALTTIAELYFKDLNFPAAIANYQSVLALLRQARPNTPLQPPRRSLTTHNFSQRITPEDPIGKPLTEMEVLTQLAYLYGKNQQYAEVITTTEAMIALQMKAGQPAPIPALKAAIAQQYQTLQQMDQAMATWQEVYNLSIGLQQYSYAADALHALAAYYQSQNQLEMALGLYQYLLDVEVRGDNLVGQMEALDQMGQIYRLQKNYPQAVVTFQRGLAIAQRISYRQDYFAAQLDQASQGQ